MEHLQVLLTRRFLSHGNRWLAIVGVVLATVVVALAKLLSFTYRLKEENRRLREATRLKSEFIADLSHELRTPLNAVIGFATLLQSGKAGSISEKQREFLGDILSSARHLVHIVGDILDLAKIDAGKMTFNLEPVELAPIAQEICDAMRVLAAEGNISIRLEVDPGVGTAMIDRGKLKQVLYNYLSNAIKFSPENARVTVRLVPDRGDTFRVEVEDCGVGIAPENLPHLFADFNQLETASSNGHHGTGLGLSLTKRIVEAQGGMVGVRSVPRVGSTFWAILPKSARDVSEGNTN